MLFWWICGGESVLPVLLLRHLGSSSSPFKYFKMWDALPWPVVIWGMGLGTDLSWKDHLHVLEPFHPPSYWAGCEAQWCQCVSDCCFLLQVAFVLQDWWLAYWWVIPHLTQSTVKSTWNLTFPQSQGERWGLFSLLFWPSHSFPEEKVNILWVDCDPALVSPHVWPSAASSQDNFQNQSHDSSWIFVRQMDTGSGGLETSF